MQILSIWTPDQKKKKKRLSPGNGLTYRTLPRNQSVRTIRTSVRQDRSVYVYIK